MKYLLALLLLGSTAAWACKDVEAVDGWVREAPPGAEMLSGYVTLKNGSAYARAIRSVSSPQFGMAEIHETREVDGQMQMREVGVLRIPAGGSASLAPGGMHLMLINPLKPLKAGDTVSLSFHCRRQPPLQVTMPVKSAVEP